MKILLAIDGSKSSEFVINELNNFTLDKNSEVIVLSVVEKLMPISAEPFAGVLVEYEVQIEEQNMKNARNIVDEAKKKIEKSFGCSVTGEVIVGSPKYSIVEVSKKRNPDLIILGSHGYPLWERVLLGSVSDFVVHNAECSVLISRSGQKTN